MLRQHAAQAVRRLVYVALNKAQSNRIGDPEAPVLESGFALTDGRRSYTASLIDVPGREHPLLMFLDQLPPEGQELWVTHVTDQSVQANRSGDPVPHVICFTPDTRIATPDGSKLVRDLQEDESDPNQGRRLTAGALDWITQG